MNPFWKKLISGFLSLLMVLSVCPVAALAESASATEPTAKVEAFSPSQTPVYAQDGKASESLGTAQMETAFRFVVPPEKGVEVVYEEAVPVEQPETVPSEDGVTEDGEAPAAEPAVTYVQRVRTEYPYHDWRAALVVSFDRTVAGGTVGLTTRCDTSSRGGVSGWHGFLINKNLSAGSELKLSGSFGTALTYGQLCETIQKIQCGAFNLSSANVGTTMTAALRIYEKANGSETGRFITLASYKYTFAKATSVNYIETAADEPEETTPPPAGEANVGGSAAPEQNVGGETNGNADDETKKGAENGTGSVDTALDEGNDTDPDQKQNPDQKTEDPDQETEDPDQETEEPDQKTEDPDQKTEDPDQKTEDPDQKTEDPDQKTEDPDQETEDPDQETEDPDQETEDPDQKKEDPDQKTDAVETGDEKEDEDGAIEGSEEDQIEENAEPMRSRGTTAPKSGLVLTNVENTAVTSFAATGLNALLTAKRTELTAALESTYVGLVIPDDVELSGYIEITVSASGDVQASFEVTPYVAVIVEGSEYTTAIPGDLISSQLTFRLPVIGATEAEEASVYHDGEFLSICQVQSDGEERYLEVKAKNFSPFSYTLRTEGTKRIVSITSTTTTNPPIESVAPLSGGGVYDDGDSVTVIAYPSRNFHFVGWYDQADTSFQTKLSAQQSYTFHVSTDLSLVALYEISEGALFTLTVNASKYTINNGSIQSGEASATYNAGESMFLSYKDDSKEFLYWVNASRNIVSTQKDYSFILAANTSISSYAANTSNIGVSARVIFRNAYKQIIISRTYRVNQSITFPADHPVKMGSVFKGWYIADVNGNPTDTEATDDTIHAAMATSSVVTVVPGYETSSTTYTIILEYVDGNGSSIEAAPEPEVMSIGQGKVYTAPAIDGFYFQYWTLNGSVVSYNTQFTVISGTAGTMRLRAVYGGSEISQEPTVVITQTFARIIDDKYVISNTMQYFAPEGYTVVESGFVFSTNSGIFGVAGGSDLLNLDNPNAKKHLTGFTDNETRYTFNGRTNDPNLTLYAKAYLIYQDPNGETHTIYSDMTVGSYNSLMDQTVINVILDPASVLPATAIVPDNTAIEDDAYENNVATLRILITDDTADPNITLGASEAAKGYDVSIVGVDNTANTALIAVKMESALAAGLAADSVRAYHAGTPMTRMSSEALLTADNTFYYDLATGNVSIAVTSFSNFTFVYPLETYPITYEGVEGATNPNPAYYVHGQVLTLAAPTRDDATFDGWYIGETKITQIAADQTGPITLTAAWASETTLGYTITWKNGETTIETDEDVAYGTTPSYDGDTPTKAATAQYTYTFAGWDPEIAPVTADATYTAQFSETLRSYTVTVHHYLKGTTIEVAEDESVPVDYGTTYTATPEETYQEKDLTVDSSDPAQPVTVYGDGVVITIYYTLPLTIKANDVSKTYGAADPELTATVTGALQGDTINYSLNRAEGQGIGTYIITVTAGDNPLYYVVTTAPGTFSINPATMTIAAISYNAPYDGQTHNGGVENAASLPAGTTIQFSIDNGATWTDTVPYITNVGTVNYIVKATNANYSEITAEGTLIVAAKAATITVADASKTYGAADPAFTGTVNGLVSTGDLGTITYSRTNDAEGVGTYEGVLTADYTLNDNYNVTVDPGDFTIDPAEITIEAQGYTGSYDGQPHAIAVTAPEGATVTYATSETGAYTADNPAYTDVGTYPVYYKVEKTNYIPVTGSATVVIDPAAVTLTANSGTETYDGTEKTVSGFTSSVEGLTFVNVSAGCGGTDAGEYEAAFSGATVGETKDSTGNYVVGTIVFGKLTINKAAITVKADDKTKVYDNDATTDPELTATVTGVPTNGDTPVYTLSRVEGQNVGNYAITVTPGSNPNYTVSVEGGTFSITALEGIVVTITGHSNTTDYDGEEHTVSGYDVAISNPLYTEADFTFSGTASVRGTDAGSYDMELKPEDFANTNDNFANVTFVIVDGQLMIDPIDVTVKADNKIKEYDNDATTDPELTATVTDVPTNGDTPVYTLSRVEGQNVGDYTITVTAEAISNPNYTVSVEGGTFSITAKAITIKADDKTKEYDNDATTDPELTATVTGAVEGDTINYTLSREAGQNVGNYAITVTAGENPNYTVSVEAGTISITPRPVTILVQNADKTYGQSDPDFTGGVSGLLSEGDLGEITYSRTNNAEGVGTYDDVLTASYTANANYAVTVVPGDFEITAKAITIKADDKTKEYDNDATTDPALTATVTGAVEGDTINYTLDREEGENVGEYAITVDAGENPNYTVSVEDGTFAITPKEITIAADDKTKVYDKNENTDPALTATVTGAVEGDTINYTLSREAGQNADDYAITVTAGENPNYTVSVEDGTFAITPRALTLTWSELVAFVYDGTERVPEFTCSGVLEGDACEAEVRGAKTAPGTYTATAVLTGEQAGNYMLPAGSETCDYTISKAAITVKADDQTKVYDNDPSTDPELTATVTGAVEGDTINYTLNREAGQNVGEYAITVTLGENPNYDVTATGGTFTITKADAAVTAAPTANELTYTGTTQALVEAGTATGGELQYSLDGENYSTDIPTGTNAGEYTVYYKVMGDSNHNDVDAATVSVTIAPASVTLTANSGTETYDGTEKTVTGFTSSVEGLTFAESVTACGSGTDAGEYNVTFVGVTVNETKDSTGNYVVTGTTDGKLTITKATMAITVTGNTGTVTYDGTEHTVSGYTATSDSGLFDASKIVHTGTSSVTQTAAGTYPIGLAADQFSYNDANFKSVTFSVTDGSLTINKKAATVTADAKTKVYGEADPTLTATTNGLVGSDTLTYTLSRAEGENVGAYTITPAGDAEQGNYTVSYATGTFTITQAQTNTVTVDITGWTYGESANMPTSTATFGEVTYTYSNAENGTYTDTVPSTAGTWYVKATVAGTDNYVGGEATKSFTITKADAAVATAPVAAANLTYTGSAQALVTAGTATGGTMQYCLTQDGTYSDTLPEGTDAGDYTVYYKVTGDENHNDTEPAGPVSVTIAKASLTLTASAVVEDGVVTPGVEAVFGETSVTLDPDTVTYEYKVQGADDSTYTITAPTAAGNYTVRATVAETDNFLSGSATADFVITASLSVTLNVYGGTLVTTGDGAYSALTLEPDQATEPNTYVGTFAPGTQYVLPTADQITKAGHAFVGWFTDENCTAGNEITAIPADANADVTCWAKWLAFKTFMRSDNFSNENYTYRVGNNNAVNLGAIFKEATGGDLEDDTAVTVTVTPIGNYVSSVLDNSASSWENWTLSFTHAGPVSVSIREGSGQEFTMNLEVVDAFNATTTSHLTATYRNVVLLNSISGSSGFSVNNGYSLFGNGFTISLSNTSNGNSIVGAVLLDNGTLDNVTIIGEVYPVANMYRGNNTQYLKNTVQMSGASVISNSYIANSRAAISITGGNATISNTTVSGGAYTNIEIGGGNSARFHNLTTIQNPTFATVGDTSKQTMGAGIIVMSASTDIYFTGYLKQHNWATRSQATSYLPTAVSTVIKDVFDTNTYSQFKHTYNNATYVNTGMIFVVLQWNPNTINDNHTNNVVYAGQDADMEVLGTTYHGGVYTVSNGTALTDDLYNAGSYSATDNAKYKPVFSYTGETSRFKTATEEDPTYYTFTRSTVHNGSPAGTISLGQYVSSGTFPINVRTGVHIIKYGTGEYSYTVLYDGVAVNGDTINVDVTQNTTHTLTYRVEDTVFYENGEALAEAVSYSWTVNIAVEPMSQAIPKPVFTVSNNTNVSASYYVSYSPSGDKDYVEALEIYKGVKVKYSYENNGQIVETTKDFSSITQKPDVYTTASTKAVDPDNTDKIDWLVTTFSDGSKLKIGVPYNHVSDKANTQKDYFCVLYSSKIYIYTDIGTEGYRHNNKGAYSITLKYIFIDPLGQETESTLEMTHKWTASTNDVQWKKFDSTNGKDNGCFAPGTMITLSDGSKKAIEDVTANDRIITWNFFTGAYEAQDISLLVDHGEAEYTVANMTFSDDTMLRTIADHGLFDINLNRFVYPLPETCEEFIGHRFVKCDPASGGYSVVTMTDAYMTTEVTHAYSITSAYNSNAIAAGLLTVAPPEEFYNWVKMGDTLRYDTAWCANMLAQYGTYDYSVFADYVTEKQYDQWNGKYLKIAVDSGSITFEEILELIDLYKEFMPE